LRQLYENHVEDELTREKSPGLDSMSN
jgi:hypothetical protein